MLPRPGLSMSAVPPLCRQANKGDRFSAKALNFFYDMPVDDLMEDVYVTNPAASEGALLIVQYFDMILQLKNCKGLMIEENSFNGFSKDVFLAINNLAREFKLAKFCTSVRSFGTTLGKKS